eukprot:TRINITY_DN90393_c0_g1_i1.p5 TRINITY_DN90393_c0_g1~~TRINITY_DN90393_c0_g1_i1.p5  ORF type:complete len:129 (-),score=15.96 TRINITY_DN90393_c0_g1_i1:41-427(-)
MELSIVIPMYNAEKYIEQCLKSILEIKNISYEVLVVDDGSTDESATIVKSFSDRRLKYIYQENGGPSKARNRGFDEACGEYVVFFDADDFIDAIEFEKFFENIKSLDIDFAVGDAFYFYSDGTTREIS